MFDSTFDTLNNGQLLTEDWPEGLRQLAIWASSYHSATRRGGAGAFCCGARLF